MVALSSLQNLEALSWYRGPVSKSSKNTFVIWVDIISLQCTYPFNIFDCNQSAKVSMITLLIGDVSPWSWFSQPCITALPKQFENNLEQGPEPYRSTVKQNVRASRQICNFKQYHQKGASSSFPQPPCQPYVDLFHFDWLLGGSRHWRRHPLSLH